MTQDRTYSQTLHRLRGAGLRPTRQRLALGRLLFEGPDRHVTAESLHGDALQASIRVSLATVYNTLHQFTGAGLLREVVVDGSKTYFDTNTSNHQHFYVESSGKLVDIPNELVDIDALPATPSGTKIERIDVIIRLSQATS